MKTAHILQPLVDRHSLAGAVTLIASAEEVLELAAVGYADVAAQRPMRPTTVFWIASMTKPMTSTLVMMLVDEGHINLDDPVEKYLPEFKGQWLMVEQDEAHVLLQRPAHPITVRNVLNHTSGLPFRSPLEEPSLDLHPLRTAVLSYAMLPLQFAPDTKYLYSNAGINTVGRIIEVVTGRPYEQFLHERLLDPLGMTATTFRPRGAQLKRLAKAYKPAATATGLEETTISQFQYPLDDRRRQPVPAGGLFSTARDVALFGRMILNGGTLAGRRYLTAAAVREMTRRQTRPEVQESYGLGWATGEGWTGHGGALATNLTIHQKRGLVTVFLVQHAGFPGDGGQAGEIFQQDALRRYGK